jgi:hypothetical protein
MRPRIPGLTLLAVAVWSGCAIISGCGIQLQTGPLSGGILPGESPNEPAPVVAGVVEGEDPNDANLPQPTTQYPLVTSVAGGHGTIAPTSGPRSANDVVGLTAVADANYRVRGWTGTDDDSSKAATNTVTMTGAKNVTVEFEIIPPIMFTVEPVSGSRPLTITGTAVPRAGTVLPEGTYTWSLNGLKDSGPLETHGRRSCVLDAGGRYTVALQVQVPGDDAPIDRPNVDTGQMEAVVIVPPWVSGRVHDSADRGIPGLAMVADGIATLAVTDSWGSYAFEVPYNWSGQIRPQGGQYTFDRNERSCGNVVSDLTGQDFLVTAGQVRISGHVRDSRGRPLVNVPVITDKGGGNTATDPNGFYDLAVDLNWGGGIAPRDFEHAFDPPTRYYGSVVANSVDQDFVAGDFTLTDAATMLRSLPDYAGGPRIMFQMNTTIWSGSPSGIAVTRELARVCGTTFMDISYVNRGVTSDDVRLISELAGQGAQLWLMMSDLAGLDTLGSLESFDPNYLHVTPKPLESYFNPANRDHIYTPGEYLFCPGRLACRRQIARWFAAGLALRNAGLSARSVAGIWVHDESARVAGLDGGYAVYETLYTECQTCGSIAEHNRRLAELRADILHAMLRGLGVEPAGDLNRDGVEDDRDVAVYQQALQTQDPIGDFNNDGQVNGDDLLAWRTLPASAHQDVLRFWWQGGYRPSKGQYLPSPWLPLESHPNVPVQSYACFSNYWTDANAPAVLAGTIDYNRTMLGLPSAPFLSLTYDATVNNQVGVDPELNRAKAQVAASRGCPMICCYALNPPSGWWMTPQLFRNEFESIKAIVEGSRSPAP